MEPRDIKTLETRVRPSEHPDIKNATFNIVSTVTKAHEMNMAYLNSLPGPLTVIKAINYKTNQKNFKPTLSPKDGQISNTGFLDELKLKVGAKVMLIKNLRHQRLLDQRPDRHVDGYCEGQQRSCETLDCQV